LLTADAPPLLPIRSARRQTHYARAVHAVAAGDTQGAKSHAAAVSAALSASAVYTEWAPLAPLFRSGLVDACGHFLASSEFRASACEVLRHLTHRRRGDTVNGAIKDAANANANANASGGGSGPEADAAADAAAVVAGLVGMCRSLGVAAQHVLQAPPAEGGSEELEYARRLTECMASLATNHLAVVPDPALRAAFLEALLGLTKYPSLAVLGAAIPAWPGLLRGMGAELPGAFQRPDGKGPGSGVYGAQQAQTQGSAAAADVSSSSSAGAGAAKLPDGAVVALLETTRTWLEQGAGVAQGLSSAGVPTAMGDQWEQEYESRDELREAWVTLRARLMEVTKLCTALEPNAAASSAASRVSTTLAWLAPGAPLDANAASAEGRSAIDDAIGASLEGVVSFIEPVVQALPLTGAAAASTTPALESMLTSLLAIDLKSPVAVSQLARLLEALGRAALVRSEAASALLNRLFALLGSLPVEDAGAPPVRAKAAMLAGRTVQAARQRVCAAVLGVCAAAPNVREPSRSSNPFFPFPFLSLSLSLSALSLRPPPVRAA
jgi:exportin-5